MRVNGMPAAAAMAGVVVWLLCTACTASASSVSISSLFTGSPLTRNQWYVLQSQGNLPLQRYSYAGGALNGRLMVYGGLTSVPDSSDRLLDDLWVFDLYKSQWKRVDITGDRPPPLAGACVFPVNVSGVAYLGLFGGISKYPEVRLSNQLYLLAADGSFLSTNFSSDVFPLPRLRGRMVALQSDLFLLFGGSSACAGPSSVSFVNSSHNCSGQFYSLNDTWLLNTTAWTWTKVITAQAPPGRWGGPLFLSGDKIFMVGGSAESFSALDAPLSVPPCNESWSMDVSCLSSSCPPLTWQQIDMPNCPKVASGTVVSYNNITIVIGGMLDVVTMTQDIRIYQNGVWTLKSSQNLPARVMSNAVSIDGQIIIFGGVNMLSVLNDMWVLDQPQATTLIWEGVSLIDHPENCLFAASAVINQTLIAVGGFQGGGVTNNVWALDLVSGIWQTWPRLPVGAAGASCNLIGSMLYVFGGSSAGTVLDALYALDSTTLVWQQIFPSNGVAPLARYLHTTAVVVNPSTQFTGTFLVVYGGAYSDIRNDGDDHLEIRFIVFSDLWLFNPDTATWNRTQPINLPTPRASGCGCIVQCENESYFFVYGGRSNTSILADAWMYSFEENNWRLLVSVSPAGRRHTFGSGVLSNGALLIHAGTSKPTKSALYFSPVEFLNDMWIVAFDSPTSIRWIKVDDQSPTQLVGQAGIVVNDTFIEFGGVISTSKFADASLLPVMTPGCNLGSFSPSDDVRFCSLCPAGTYSDEAGATSCMSCQGDSYSLEGSTDVSDCNICEPNACSGHGTCSISSGDASCHCESNYAGAKCRVNIFGEIVVPTALFIVLIGVTIYFARKYFIGRMSRMQKYQRLQEQMLIDSQLELAELSKVWEIPYATLAMTKRIDLQSPGAFGEVWLAQWDDRPVAVKTLKQAVSEADYDSIREFQSEIKFMRTLRHRNVVFFYGGGISPEKLPFLVTEYMSRGSLRSILDNTAVDLSWKRRISFTLDTAAGMKFLHELRPPRLHRDLKTGNLLVSEQWVVKLADFGTARIVSNLRKNLEINTKQAQPQQSQQLDQPNDQLLDEQEWQNTALPQSEVRDRELTRGVGTLLWTAPEILRCESYDQQCDVYSFAIVMYEICTRLLPWESMSQSYAIANAVMSGHRPELPAGFFYPSYVIELMRQCWQDKPAARPSFASIVETICAWEDS